MIVWVQCTSNETGIYSTDDKILEFAGSGESEGRLKFGVSQFSGVFGKGEKGKLAEFEGLSCGKGGERWVASVVGVRAITEDLKEGKIGCLLWRGGRKSLNLGSEEKFGKYVGSWSISRSSDQIDSSAG